MTSGSLVSAKGCLMPFDLLLGAIVVVLVYLLAVLARPSGIEGALTVTLAGWSVTPFSSR